MTARGYGQNAVVAVGSTGDGVIFAFKNADGASLDDAAGFFHQQKDVERIAVLGAGGGDEVEGEGEADGRILRRSRMWRSWVAC